MSNPATTRGSPISQHLHATRRILQDTIFNVKIATAQDKAEVDALERDIVEVLHLIWSWRNAVAPINKIPPEILALIPEFLDPHSRDHDIIALTHVCRAWREVFVSRSSLWVNLDCKDGGKTRVYLERSKSSPIGLSLHRTEDISPHDPLFWVIPHAIGRLKSLHVEAAPESLQVIIAHLSHPAPLLEHLTIQCYSDDEELDDHPTLTPAFFNGDLPSLRTLYLDAVHTDLPWRNMVNLTSFMLASILPDGVSIEQFLDFFEGAPHLREISLRYAIPMTSVQNGRLVSLAHSKSMRIEDACPSSVLLDHLLIPVGARLETHLSPLVSPAGGHLPRSLDNLKNLSNFTTIHISFYDCYLRMKFSGPNGKVITNSSASRSGPTGWVIRSLAWLDTSKVEQLKIDADCPLSRDSLCQTLLPMTDLCTLTLSECANQHTVTRVLHPGMISSEVMVCPKLEKLVLVLHGGGERFDITSVTEMAAARASRGGRLKTIRIVDRHGIADLDVSELRRYVWNVEYGPMSVQSTASSDEDD